MTFKNEKNLILIILIFILALTNIFLIGAHVAKAFEDGTDVINGEGNIEIYVVQNFDKLIELGNNQVLLQQGISIGPSKLDVAKEYENLEISVPNIQEKKPDSAIVLVNGIKLNEEMYQYDLENSMLRINIDKDKNIKYWGKSQIYPSDNYQIIYSYSDVALIDNENINSNTCIYTKFENYEEIKSQNSINYDINQMEENTRLKEFISLREGKEEEIYKGYMYQGNQNDTVYEEKYTIEISNMQNLNELNISNEKQMYTYYETTSLEKIENKVNDNIYYQSTTINKEDIFRILGNDGIVTIKNENGEILEQITKDTEANEEGNIVINYENTKKINIITTKPQEEGWITISNKKVINPNTGYEKQDLEKFEYLEESIKVNDVILERNIKLLDTTSKVKLETNKENLSTIIENKDIELNVTLKSNDSSDTLYKNPTIKISFPEEVEEISIKEANLLFENELKLEKKYSEGKDIFIELSGEQTQYKEEALEGALVTLKVDLKLNMKAINNTSEISVEVNNNGETIGDSKEINIVAPREMITVNSIKEYDIETVGEEKIKEIKLERKAENKNITIESEIINNNEGKISDVKIIGDLPTNGTLEIEQKNINNNLNAKFQNRIETIGREVEIYYTNNRKATEDLLNENNNWKKDYDDLSEIEKYMIVVPEMEQYESIRFSYSLDIPANLEYNQQGYNGYTVLYTNSTTGISNKADSTYINLTTGQGPILDGELKAYVGGKEILNGETVKAGEIIEYRTNITNSGTEKALNVVVNASIPENTTNVENSEQTEVEITIPEIPIGEAKEVSYKVKVNKELQEEKEIRHKVSFTYDNEDKETNEIKMIFVPSDLSINVELGASEDTKIIMGDVVEYIATIENNTSQIQNNISLEWNIEKIDNITSQTILEIRFADGRVEEINETMSTEQNVIIDEIPANSKTRIKITLKTGDNNENTRYLTLSAVLKKENEEYRSNITKPRILYGTKNYIIEMKANNENEYLKSGEEIIYTINVTNNNMLDSEILLKDQISNNLTIREVLLNNKTLNEDSDEGKMSINNNEVTVITNIKSGEMKTVTIKTVINYIEDLESEIKVINKASIRGINSTVIESNEIIHFTENKEDMENPDESEKNDTYSIRGFVWNDKNKDGVRDEIGIKNIQVKLVDLENYNIVKDDDNNEIVTSTNDNGEYILSKIPQGEYIVVFEFDSEKYKITTYKKENIEDSKSSKVISKEVNINGKIKIYGITDIIKIRDKSISNINMGLIEKEKFDLKLEKYINKIIINDQNNNTVYNYNKEQLAKVEISPKSINTSTIIIEYGIDISNIGEIPGYIKTVYDYIPNEFLEYVDLNNEWYKESNILVNNSLANVKIIPGDTKSITLTVAMKLNQNKVSTYRNVAKIGEITSEEGIILKNNNSQNDISQAEIIISLRTGKQIFYTIVITIIISILAMGIYLIIKKVL